ncbi:NAD(P) transhydrogenase subunit alpha [Vibrio cholerae]|nr:NAD(P) transhydrogenase subunit alpha [Vibrio cholerae]
MQIGVPREQLAGETRVAASPSSVEQLIKLFVSNQKPERLPVSMMPLIPQPALRSAHVKRFGLAHLSSKSMLLQMTKLLFLRKARHS